MNLKVITLGSEKVNGDMRQCQPHVECAVLFFGFCRLYLPCRNFDSVMTRAFDAQWSETCCYQKTDNRSFPVIHASVKSHRKVRMMASSAWKRVIPCVLDRIQPHIATNNELDLAFRRVGFDTCHKACGRTWFLGPVRWNPRLGRLIT